MQYRKDKKGNQLSILGYGCMRFTKNGSSIDLEKAEQELMYGISHGINYLDTAYVYPGNEEAVGKILAKNHCREEINLATKLPHYLIRTRAGAEKKFQEELQRLQTDYIDYYLMHMLNDCRTWEKLVQIGIRDWIEEKKKSGVIRNIGFSYHGNSENFRALLDAYDWDFCQIQYNYINVDYQAGMEGLRYAAQKGLAVVIMEPLLGGRLANLSDHVAEVFSKEKSPVEHALDFLWDQPEVSLLLSGMSSRQQVEDNLAYADRSAVGCLKEEEKEAYRKAKEIYDSMSMVGCTGCAYCMPCPFGLNIPEIFKAYNLYGLHGLNPAKEAYEKLGVLADACRSCHHCEKECPQNLKISQVMKDVRALLGPPAEPDPKWMI